MPDDKKVVVSKIHGTGLLEYNDYRPPRNPKLESYKTQPHRCTLPADVGQRRNPFITQ